MNSWFAPLPFTTAAMDEEAVVISDCTAKEPEESVAAVSVRAAEDQTSDARVPKEESVRELYDHTSAGKDAIEETIEESVEAREAVCAFVFAFTTAVTDEVAVVRALSV